MSNNKAFHNFIIVGSDKSGKMQRVLLIEIGTELYSRAIYGVIHASPLQKRFEVINDVLTDSQGYVSTGQVLYLPSIHPISSDAEISHELVLLNEMILDKLDDKAKVIHGRRHHLLSTMVASTGLSADIGIDLRKSYSKLAQEQMKTSLEKIAFYAKSARKLNSDRALNWGQSRISTELTELETGSQKYIKYANTADTISRAEIEANTGIQWNRMMYDVKRVGIDRASIKVMSRHLSATIRLASKVRHLGKYALAISAGEALYETGEVCRRQPWGTVCYDEGFKQSGGLAGGMLAAKLSEEELERLGGAEKTCNLLFDEEGWGLPVCNIMIPTMISVASGFLGHKVGSHFGDRGYKIGYRIIHCHKVRVEE